MRALTIVFLLAFGAYAIAQDSCDYQATQGTEFVFAEQNESLRNYGYQLWSKTTEPGTSLPYDEYVGKKGKFTGEKSTGGHGVLKFYDVVMSDCSKLFLMSLKDNLADENVEMHGVQWLQKPSRNWRANVRVDDMTDAKTCMVSPKSEMPYPIFVYSNGGKAVSAGVVGGDFPGKDVAFRVDKLAAISEKEGLSGGNTQRIIQQIRAGGKSLLVRSYKWPDDVPDTKEFSLEGLVAALDECRAKLGR